ncbi:hypothetical protein QFC20_004646 [Naganishia adeliensis]|uniref:Uncharacterized protein n=1 Tax=Naganishia adeliensis TaxID=92952 RepID=A0ACC2VYL3_9TREE|nr:hypothetical protein QFC20_004646 [Naganishia adeliensis]
MDSIPLRQSLATTIRSRESTLIEPQTDAQLATTPTPNAGQWPEKAAPDPNEVTFDGPDDPEDPLNFPTWRKWIIVVTIASASTCVTCASSMAASTYAGLQRSFHISEEVAILTVSLFVLGLGVGPLFLGPTSEFVGRRIVYLWSYTGFLLAGGTVADLFETRKLGTPMTVYSTTPFLGPVLGPLIAGFINYSVNWRWTYYVLMIWSGVELVLVYLLVVETYKPELLRRKAVRLRRETGNTSLYAPIEHSRRSFLHSLGNSLKTPFLVVAPQLMAELLTLWVALVLGVLYLFFNAFPLTFERNHGFNQQQSGMSFLGLGVGQLLAAFSTPIWSKLYKRAAAKNGGHAPPEARLVMGMAGAIGKSAIKVRSKVG